MRPAIALLLFLPLAAFAQSAHGGDATLAEQKECYEQAQKLRTKSTSVLQHYSKRENVCFARTYSFLYEDQDQRKLAGYVGELVDAFEGVTYGSCLVNPEGKLAAGGDSCWLSDPSGGENKRFNDFASWSKSVMSTYLSKHF